MEIKVFGPGCARCAETEKLVKEVVAAKGTEASVRKISDLKEMMAAGIMSTPAVMVDGVVKCTGRVPAREDVAAWLEGAPVAPGGEQSAAVPSGCCCGGKC